MDDINSTIKLIRIEESLQADGSAYIIQNVQTEILSKIPVIDKHITSTHLELLPFLMRVVQGESAELRLKALNVLLDFSYSIGPHVIMSRELGFLNVLNDSISNSASMGSEIDSVREEGKDDFIIDDSTTVINISQKLLECICDLLCNFTHKCSLAVAIELVAQNCHVLLVKLLQFIKSTASLQHTRCWSKVICALLHLLRHPLPTDLFVSEWSNISYLIEVMTATFQDKSNNNSSNYDASNNEVYQAQCLLTLVIGRNKWWHGSTTMDSISDSKAIENLCYALNHVLISEHDNRSCFEIDQIPLCAVLRTILIIALVSDTNKKIIIDSSTLLPLLVSIIEMFLSNVSSSCVTASSSLILTLSLGDECNDATESDPNDVTSPAVSPIDLEAVALSIELILQTTFYYTSSLDLCNSYLTANYALDLALKQCLKLPNGVQPFRTEQKLCAFNLISRLHIGYLRSLDPAISDSFCMIDGLSYKNPLINPNSHGRVFINYEVSDPNKHLIFDLAGDLRCFDVEVFLFDENDERIESTMLSVHSCDTVVNCISSEFRSSANCRMQTIRAQELQSAGKLTIISVIVDANYEIVSTPSSSSPPPPPPPLPSSTPDNPVTPAVGWLDRLLMDGKWYPMMDREQVRLAGQFVMDSIKSRLASSTAVTLGAGVEEGEGDLGLGLGLGLLGDLPSGKPSTPLSSKGLLTTNAMPPPSPTASPLPLAPVLSTPPSPSFSTPEASTQRKSVLCPRCVSFTTPTRGNVPLSKPRQISSGEKPPDDVSLAADFHDLLMAASELPPLDSGPVSGPSAGPVSGGATAAATAITTSSDSFDSKENISVLPLESAWKYLNEPLQLSDPKSMANFLADLGITCANDLMQCDTQLLKQMAALFKPLPRKSFAKHIEAATGIKKDLLCDLKL